MLTEDESFESALHKWVYDIAFFRDNCKDKDRYVEEPDGEEEELDAKGHYHIVPEDPVMAIKEEAIEEEK